MIGCRKKSYVAALQRKIIAAIAAMNITLKPEFEQFIQAQLAAGRYTTLDDLVSEALALLVQREQRLAELQHKIAIGTEQVRNGQVTYGEAVFAQLQEKLDRMTQSNS